MSDLTLHRTLNAIIKTQNVSLCVRKPTLSVWTESTPSRVQQAARLHFGAGFLFLCRDVISNKNTTEKIMTTYWCKPLEQYSSDSVKTHHIR